MKNAGFLGHTLSRSVGTGRDGSVARSRLRPFKGLLEAFLYARQPCSGRIELEGKTGTKWNTA